MNKKNNSTKEMFDSISKEYDFINNLITFGSHKKWKKQIVDISKKNKPKQILDLATGTADIAIELTSIENCKITGLDISSKMLSIGQTKINKLKLNSNISLEEGDAENLKFNDSTFDVVTIGYGVRNFTNLKNSLNEIYRVLKKDGLLIILETSLPTNPLMSFFYNIHTKFYVRLIGKIFSNNSNAYNYLESSAKVFPHGENFKKILQKVNFKDIRSRIKLFGASTIYIAKK
jgi:demethylmenaquinone methyltransferase/2-methoxy-6-polyprenyl-1,4-benzoquinol methylase